MWDLRSEMWEFMSEKWDLRSEKWGLENLHQISHMLSKKWEVGLK